MRQSIIIELPWEERGVTFVGDPHIDSPGHARDLLLQDMGDAKARGDIMVVMGDVWSMILPGDLKRFTSGRHGERADAIINQRIDEAEALFAPYADNIDLMLCGNHETAVIKHHHVDPLAMLIDRLNRHKTTGALPDNRIAYGGYTCWLKIVMRDFTNPNKPTGGAYNVVWLHHGRGGGATVTKGMIDANRVQVANVADLYVMGHKHTSITDKSRYTYMTPKGVVKTRQRDFIIVGGYSGNLVDDGEHKNGYTLDYSDEQFYSNEAQGSARVLFTPQYDEDAKLRRRIETYS